MIVATRGVNSYFEYNSYLVITNTKTRYKCDFLTDMYSPPSQLVSSFLNINGLRTSYHTFCNVQSGELWHSATLCYTTATTGYVMECTGSNSPHQNGKTEYLNCAFGVMVLSLLYSSDFHPQYCSATLVHAVHPNTWLWHSALDINPFEA